MRNLIILFFAGIILSTTVLAQTSNYSATVIWQRYKLESQNLSVLLPKLPVLNDFNVNCKQEDWKQYAIYAEDVVYGINVITKSKTYKRNLCGKFRNFGKKSFQKRIEDFKSSNNFENYFERGNEKIIKVGNKEGIILKGSKYLHLFVNDSKEKRWFEFWVSNSNMTNTTVKNFINSISFKVQDSAIEIGTGAERTLGDEIDESQKSKLVKNGNEDNQEDSGLRLFTKPEPKYTEVAKDENYQGSVVLRVTFLPNGGIGKITPINRLRYGLTEQAIAAAKKIVFIPAKRNGKNIGITKRIQYTYTIY